MFEIFDEQKYRDRCLQEFWIQSVSSEYIGIGVVITDQDKFDAQIEKERKIKLKYVWGYVIILSVLIIFVVLNNLKVI